MTPEHTALVTRLAALHASKKHMPGIGGQQAGLEQYRIVASGNDLESIPDAAAALREQAGKLALRDSDYMRCEKRAADLTTERDTLRAEVERWREDSMRQAATINRMAAAVEDRNEVDRLRHVAHEAEVAALRKALETVQHGVGCPAQPGWAAFGPCTCGLDAALADKQEPG